MGPYHIVSCIFLSSIVWASGSPSPQDYYPADYLRHASDAAGHSFSYEFVSPQRIITGCEGTRFASGDRKTQFFFIDATGKKKVIYPDVPAEVVLPSPSGIPGISRTQKLYMHELCFPEPCETGPCSNTGIALTSSGWSFPKCKHALFIVCSTCMRNFN
jgi:hypothetical protein